MKGQTLKLCTIHHIIIERRTIENYKKANERCGQLITIVMQHIRNYSPQYTPQEIQLANEIAERLHDPGALSQWLSYAHAVSHEFLRKELNKVCSMPDNKVTTTRVRLFVHIVKNHIQYGNGYSRY
jgi:hypothetical protein